MNKKTFTVRATFQHECGLLKEIHQIIEMPKEADEIDACSAFTEYYKRVHDIEESEIIACEAFRTIDGTDYFMQQNQ